ncbi:probable lipid phosphate phosphatase beta isoform X2 [Tripterygium wilfordii]|uniref:probable lipid phosphate phosphatase beta isoform X2 n=1 Tax=Tripterygium wilfordii TaxID=458696 RepID=UPI0018F859EB|nr:probable lipid phosphate phosphatase beta isoform X2 [Tripterygium wilfordii]
MASPSPSPSPPPPPKEPSTTTVVTKTTNSRLIVLDSLIRLDTSLSKSLHTLFHPFLPGPILLLLEYSADFRLSFPVCLSLLFVPWSSNLRFPFLLPLIVGLLVDLSLIGLIKFVFRRSRPHYNPNMSAVVSVDHFSFPSGHASRVFYLASFISLSAATIQEALTDFRPPGGVFGMLIGEDEGKFVASVVLGVWAWAAVTSTSRVLLGRHFVLDVLAGVFVGVLEGHATLEQL